LRFSENQNILTVNSYTETEESANRITHGLGTLLAFAGLIALVIRGRQLGTNWHLAGFIVFGITLILMYLSSTLYHTIPGEKFKTILRKIDHSAIYLLIAGTYTPFLLTSLRSNLGWILFGVIWSIAFIGIIIKVLTGIKARWVSAVTYIGMGWIAVIPYKEMMNNIPHFSLLLMIAGGLLYTFGTVFYVWKKLPYNHAIWHLFVMGASVCHFFAVYYLV
jgi:hemolysin III